ncbi:MAG: carbon starvation protein A, partial [Candidatus Omnitrophica bacterium]|nr:carbon starvation protein A [Candidatus Omnitrophota bacterium]
MALGYRFYSKYLAQKIYRLDDSHVTPSVAMEDGVDYVPTHRAIVFNHHFASIAGLSPILGPSLAVIWGWFPTILWLVVGSVLMGAVHDMSSLVLSLRNRGRSIGQVANNLVGNRARILFLLIIFFAITLAMAVFVKVVSQLLQSSADNFQTYPGAVFPSGMLMIIALACGVLLRKKVIGLLPVSIIGTFLTFLCIWIGTFLPIHISYETLLYSLLIYAFAASVLPVWMLLQPRDFINAFALYIGMILLYLSVFMFQPHFVAPAINVNPDLPSMIPLLFVVVACGAISGFHSLVASGTTSKQLSKETDARPVGYGAMLAEGALGVIAVVACTAGLNSKEQWLIHYQSWASAQGLGAKLSIFVQGAANLIANLGIPIEFAATFIALVVVSFALTTLDSGTRILRYNVEEISETFHLPFLKNRYLSSLIAVVAIGYLAVSKWGTTLWVLFGTTNQLLAGLALLTATVYLVANKRPSWATTVPMVVMLIITFWALLLNLKSYIAKGEAPLIIVGSAILLIAIGLIFEVILFFVKRGSGPKSMPAEAEAEAEAAK